MGSDQHYSLRWNDYTVKIVTAFQSLRDEEDFVDVTVACDGHSYSAHKMVLSACSPYFRVLLRANPCQHPIVILKDVGHMEMERLLEFMYNGEVSIAQDQLAAFLKTAENLKIRGLAGTSDDMEQFQRADISYAYNSRCSQGGGTSGRSSPSLSYAPSQASKDDDLTTDVPSGYLSRKPDSPPSKRRKRSSAPAASHSDANAASHSTECVVSESGVSVSGSSAGDGCGGNVGASGSGPNADSDDPRQGECREMKIEPGLDACIDVYADGPSDLGSDPSGQQLQPGDPLDTRSSVMYPLAMPGPSGTLGGQDTSQEPGGGGMQLKQESDVMTSEWWAQDSDHIEQGITQSNDSHTHYRPMKENNIHLNSSSQFTKGRSAPLHQNQSPGINLRDVSDDIHITWQRSEAPLSHLENLVTTPFSLDDMNSSMGNTNILVTRGLPLDRPWFSCSQCGKSFKTKVTLSRHERIHTGNAFPCPYCPKVFYQVSNVKYHVRSMHGQHYDPGSRIRNTQ